MKGLRFLQCTSTLPNVTATSCFSPCLVPVPSLLLCGFWFFMHMCTWVKEAWNRDYHWNHSLVHWLHLPNHIRILLFLTIGGVEPGNEAKQTRPSLVLWKGCGCAAGIMSGGPGYDMLVHLCNYHRGLIPCTVPNTTEFENIQRLWGLQCVEGSVDCRYSEWFVSSTLAHAIKD